MAYAFVGEITIDKNLVPNTDQVDFIFLFKGTYSFLKSAGNGGDVQNASGFDIGWFADAGLTTKLKWHPKFWDDATGDYIAFIKVPTVYTAVNTKIYIGVGDASITTDQSDTPGTYKSAFKGVMPLGEGSNANIIDVTSNANVGPVNGFPLTDTAPSPIHQSTDFGVGAGPANSGNDLADFGANNSLNISGNFTYKCLFNVNDYPSAYQEFGLMTKGLYLGSPLFTPPFAKTSLFVQESGGDLYVGANSDDGTTNLVINYNLGPTINGTWVWAAMTGDGTDMKLYVNGQLVASNPDTRGAIPTTDASAYISGYNFGGLGTVNRFNGKIAESNWLDIPLSADWLATEYNNQSNPAAFYSVNYPLSTTAIKTVNGLAKASVKTVNQVAIANVKTINGLA